MTDTDRKQFGIVIAALASTFGKEASQPMLLGYWMGLGDMNLAGVEQAAGRAMRQCKFMPTVAELRELAGEMLPADRAALAWEAFRKAVQSHGYYTSVDFDDKLINATVRNLGGWLAIAEQLEEEGDKWLRKDFERVYQTFLRTGVTAGQALPLGGFHEQNNLGNGYTDHIPPPTLIETNLPPHHPGLIALPAAPNALPTALLENTLKGLDDAIEAPEKATP